MGDMVSFWDSESGDLGMYNRAFLKRARCFLCGNNNAEYFEHWIYRVEFRKDIEQFKNENPELVGFENVKPGYYESKYMCDHCLNEFFSACPEIFKKIELVIPK